MKKSKVLTILILFSTLVVMILTSGILAYFSGGKNADNSYIAMNINQLFGRLDTKKEADSASWGKSETDPYLIYEYRHLKNLYLLQNNKDKKLINSQTFFQISDTAGAPCVVMPSEKDTPIKSIGSEDFPFVSHLKGVASETPITFNKTKADNTTATYQSQVSVLYNVKVNAYAGQIDIGLFGNVGVEASSTDGTGSSNPNGSIEMLMIADIQIISETVGDSSKENHTNHFITTTHETNHIGILAGHAEGSTIKNISVFYTDENIENNVTAFDVNTNGASYTSAGGIIGYYKDITVGTDTLPVSSVSDSSSNTGVGGGDTIGKGTGFMFSGDIWDTLAESTSLTETSYNLQESFGSELYTDGNKNYFTNGVFTFAHSWQISDKDKIVKLWTDPTDSSTLIVADSYTLGDPKGLTTDGVTYSEITDPTTVKSVLSSSERLMITFDYNGVKYTLTQNGTNIEAQPTSFDNYVVYQKDDNGNFVYDENGEKVIVSSTPVVLIPRSKTDNTSLINNYSGIWSGDNLNYNSNYYLYWSLFSAPSFSTSKTSIYINAAGAINITTLFGGTSFLQYNGSAFGKTSTESSGTSFKFYKINTSQQYEMTQQRMTFEPSEGAAQTSYDMSTNVLYYSGKNTDSASASEKYQYEIKSLKDDLKWQNKKHEIIEKIDTALVMADAVNYYKISLGILGSSSKGIVNVPLGTVKQDIPMGSVAFQVQGSGISGDVAKINVIVATNPSQLVSQVITCRKMNTASWSFGSSDLTPVSSFPLPPVAGIDTASTTPIYLREYNEGDSSGTYTPAYTNMNTVLVAYTMEIPCTDTGVYFLSSDKGAASFVYFSVDSVAADGTRNGDHDNELFFANLNSIDYVFSYNNLVMTIGTNTSITVQVSNQDGTVSDKKIEYLNSLIMPYIGLKYDSSATDDPNKTQLALNATYNFKFAINRQWNNNFAELYINAMCNIDALGTYTGINYTDNSYATSSSWIFADKVNIAVTEINRN